MLRSEKYNFTSVGYLVKDNKVLLVHHRGFNKWVPPGGHVELDESFAEAAIREFFEETNLKVKIISAGPRIHTDDDNATFQPLPFYSDILVEGFKRPTLCFYYLVEMLDTTATFTHQEDELHDIGWFSKEELLKLSTFDQVRSLAMYVLENYPTMITSS